MFVITIAGVLTATALGTLFLLRKARKEVSVALDAAFNTPHKEQ